MCLMPRFLFSLRPLALWLALAAAPLFAQAPASAVLKVTGDVPMPLTLSREDLAQMPRETVKLTEMNHETISCEGVALRAILVRAGVPLGKELHGKNLAIYILAKAHDGYQVVFSIGELDSDFGDLHIIVADKQDGKDLTGDRGPLRLVSATDKRPARSVRMLEELQVVQLRK